MSKRPKWRLMFWRAVGEFKNGERKMTNPDRLGGRSFHNETAARKATCANWKPPFKAFVHRTGKPPKRITEIQINYPAE